MAKNNSSSNDPFLRYNITGAWNPNHSMQFNIAYVPGSLPQPWPYVMCSTLVSLGLATWSLARNIRINIRFHRGESLSEITDSGWCKLKKWGNVLYNSYRCGRGFALFIAGSTSIAATIVLLLQMTCLSSFLEHDIGGATVPVLGCAVLTTVLTLITTVVAIRYGQFAELAANMGPFNISRAGLQTCADARLNPPNITDHSWSWPNPPRNTFSVVEQQIGIAASVMAFALLAIVVYVWVWIGRVGINDRPSAVRWLTQSFILMLMVPFMAVTVYYHYYFQTTPVPFAFYDLQVPLQTDYDRLWVAGLDYPIGFADCFETMSPTDKWGFWNAWTREKWNDWSRRIALL